MTFLKEFMARHYHSVHGGAHLSYFALVFIEGHGLYALVAGGLFVLSLIGMLLKEDV